MAADRVFVQTRLDKDTARRLAAKARAESRSVADYLRLLIIAHLRQPTSVVNVRPTADGDGK